MVLSKLLVSFSDPEMTYELIPNHQYKAILLNILLDSASSTMIQNKRDNTEPKCNPSWTRKSLKVSLILTRIQTFLYIDCAILINYSSTSSFFRAYHTPSLGTQKFLPILQMLNENPILTKYFSCNCLITKMAFAV